jgi:hypothetical protein
MHGFQRVSFYFLLGFLCLIPGLIFGADIRTGTLDMFIIIDGSSSLSSGRDEAVRWLCDYAVDSILREGDRLTIWLAADPVKELFSGTLSGADSMETVKTLIRAHQPQGGSADYARALRAAAGKEAAASGMTYTLIISGSQAGSGSFPNGEAAAALLRYSLVREFSGWRAVVTSPGIENRVRQAAAAFIN